MPPTKKWVCTTCLQEFAKYELRHQHPQGGTCPSTLVEATVTGMPTTGLDRWRMTDEEYDRFLAAHAAPYQRGGEHYNEPVSSQWRDEIGYDFTRCGHGAQTIVEIDAVDPLTGENLGKWGLAICVRCGHVATKECPHVETEWRLDGAVLICKNCGVDCT
jgi:hypothetical protein